MDRVRKISILSLVMLVLAIGACGKKDDSSDPGNPNASADSSKPIEWVENIVNHTDLSSKFYNTYSVGASDICLQIVKQGERKFVRMTLDYCGSNYLSSSSSVAEFTLVGYKLLSSTGVEVGNVYQYSNAKNLTDFCTGDLKDNCSIVVETYRTTSQSESKRITGIKINEAVITK